MLQKTALVIGGTGLVGSELIKILLADDRFATVKLFGRRTTGLHHPKLQEHVINFDEPGDWQHLVAGDVAFSALGTTLKTAGSKKAQYKVDYTYQYEFAKAAAKNDVAVYVLVSSAMANEHSRLFYTRIKGELERDIKQLPFQSIHIMQPGMLVGARPESRTGEQVGIKIIRFLNSIGIAKKQKPIDAAKVAQAMVNVSFKTSRQINVFSLLDVFAAAQ